MVCGIMGAANRILTYLVLLVGLSGDLGLSEFIDGDLPHRGDALEMNDQRPFLTWPSNTTIEGRPQCYSSPAADPSEGAWRKCDRGVEESPAYTGNVTGDWSREVERCSGRWAKEHAGEGPQPYWMWEPSNCRLDALDAGKFCRVVEGRKGILFVGDSLTQQSAVTLAAVLRAKVVWETSSFYSKLYSACGGKLKFLSRRNDFLETSRTDFPDLHCEQPDPTRTKCFVFATDEVLSEFDTVVVNSGAHAMNGGIEAYRAQMKTASEALTASMKRLHGEDAILVVRNTPPGHWECDERTFVGPVDVDVATTLVAEAPDKYGWQAFAEKNEILEDAFEATDGDWKVIDAYTPTLQRADSHFGSGDCLHYCVGKDGWTVGSPEVSFELTHPGEINFMCTKSTMIARRAGWGVFISCCGKIFSKVKKIPGAKSEVNRNKYPWRVTLLSHVCSGAKVRIVPVSRTRL